MELTLLWTIALRELRESLRNKWLAFYAIGFAALAFALSQASLASAGYSGLGGFGRTAASLINALLLFVPLLGLSVGAGALAGDRERGTLTYLLAQPVNRAEVFFGKALGAGMAVTVALAVGFGLAALALASAGDGDAPTFLALTGYTMLLALASLGLGFVVSALTRKGSTAMGASLLLWLGLVFFGDLGLVGATLALRPTPTALLAMLLLNPLQAFKLGAIYSLRSTLDTLGAAGQYALYYFGDNLSFVLSGLLVAWIALSFGLAFTLFNRRGDL
ncbi:MAG TPA: ABC transporter permease subunit [Anaerolineales bacterium]|nr:ABC transporter permease subunit [Anaerolineales bacterium]